MLTHNQHEDERDVVSPESIDLNFIDTLPNEVRKPRPGEPKDLVQKQMQNGVWRTLCNLCHRTIPASFEDFPENGDEDFGYDPDRTVCFEVTPCNVTVESCMFWWGMGAEENWRKQKPRAFVVCAECFAKLDVTPTQLPVTPVSIKGNLSNGAIVPCAVVGLPEDECEFPLLEDLGDME